MSRGQRRRALLVSTVVSSNSHRDDSKLSAVGAMDRMELALNKKAARVVAGSTSSQRGLPRPVPPWGQRAHRAYLNATEVFAPFAALVVVAQLTGKADTMTAFWSASFFWLRLAHSIVYWAGIPYLRTVLFTLAFVAEAGIFWEVIR